MNGPLRADPNDTYTTPFEAESINFLRSFGRGLASLTCRLPNSMTLGG